VVVEDNGLLLHGMWKEREYKEGGGNHWGMEQGLMQQVSWTKRSGA